MRRLCDKKVTISDEKKEAAQLPNDANSLQ